MNWLDYTQIGLYVTLLALCTPLLGGYMAKVYAGERTWLTPLARPAERMIYRLSGIDPAAEMNWTTYARSLLSFSVVGFLVLLVMQMAQRALPLNTGQLPAVPWALALNTATSFMTNTNWQAYAGEVTLSDFTQMLGLGVQNFLSAATDMAVLIALARGLARRSVGSAGSIGNFWVDLVRSIVYVLLPLSIALAVALVSQGVVQTFAPNAVTQTLAGGTQTIPLGPAASQVAIKQLGTNGGGFFGVNSAHPLENPTPLSNFLQMFAILLIPATLTYTYGVMVGNRRHGWVLFTVMLLLFAAGLATALVAEHGANPIFGVSPSMEGKEVRIGVANSVLWATATTAASNGSVVAMHASLAPLAGLVTLLNIMMGEVIFGGVGAGLYGMVIFVILTVFIAGLMVGRTPEYLGKKVEAHEIKMATLAILLPSACILLFSALASVSEVGLASRTNAGPHGLSEILYAFSSGAGNNGSAFAGLNANTLFYNLLMALAMWIGRFGVIAPALAIAGSMAGKRITPPSPGALPTDTVLFGGLLAAVVLVIGALTFLPTLALGPIVEHFLMLAGRTF